MSAVKKFAAFLAALLICLSASGVAFADNRNTIVFVTDSGTKYHTEDCGYLWQSRHSRTLEEVVSSGRTACSRCHPPLPDFSVSATPIPTYESSSSSSSNSNYRATPSTPYRRSPSTTDVPQKQLEKRWRPTMREIMICIALTTIVNWWIAAAQIRKRRKADSEELAKERAAMRRSFELDWSKREKEMKQDAKEQINLLEIKQELLNLESDRQLRALEESQKRREKKLKAEAKEQLRSTVLEVQAEVTQSTAVGMLSLLPDRYGITLPAPPLGARIAADGLPCSDGSGVWGTDYTFYTSKHGKVFHRFSCSYLSWDRRSRNAFQLSQSKRYRPCKHCTPELPDLSWYEEYVSAAKGVTQRRRNLSELREFAQSDCFK